MTTYLSVGTYIIASTSVPAATYDLDDKTDGVDYVKLSSRPRLGLSMNYSPGVSANPGGSQYAVVLGVFTEQFTIDDLATAAQFEVLEKFFQTYNQTSSKTLYVVRVTANGSPPTLKNFYQKSATAAVYLPVKLTGLSGNWDETNQYYNVRLAMEACWS